jgi:hypothetical protein
MLLLTDTDPILVIAAVVAWELYGRGPTVVLLPEMPVTASVASVRVDDNGRLHVEPAAAVIAR